MRLGHALSLFVRIIAESHTPCKRVSKGRKRQSKVWQSGVGDGLSVLILCDCSSSFGQPVSPLSKNLIVAERGNRIASPAPAPAIVGALALRPLGQLQKQNDGTPPDES